MQAMIGTQLPCNQARVLSDMAEMDADLAESTPAERRAMIIAAADDPQAARDLAEARVTRIHNAIEAQTMGAAFYEVQNLEPEDRGYYVVETEDEVEVAYIGQSGKPPKRQSVFHETPFDIPFNWLSSDEVEWLLQTLYTGNIGSLERANKRVQLDIQYQIDNDAKTLLDSVAVATFGDDVISAHRFVHADNLPTGNYVDMSAAPYNKTVIDLDVLKKILELTDLAGFRARTIQMASSNRKEMRNFLSLVAGISGTGGTENPDLAIPGDAHMELWRSGELNSFYGTKVEIVMRNTLAPGTLYVSGDKPVGIMQFKPALNKSIHDQSVDMLKKNMESLMVIKAIAQAIPAPWSVNFLKLKFA
jgi:hypothetical protein